MNPFYNCIEVIGNLGKTPELKYFNDGTPSTKLNIAVTEKFTDKTTGEVREKTDWFAVWVNGMQAEIVCKYLHKGDSAFVRGAMRSRRYEQNGQWHTVWEIQADKVIMLTATLPQDTAKETL